MVEQAPQFLDALSYAAGSDRAFWLDFMTDSSGNAGTATTGGTVTSTDQNVTQNGTPNMSVNVAAGVAYVRGTTSATQGFYRCYNDATVNKTIAAAHATLSRRDIVVAHLYDNLFDASGNNFWLLEVVTGTPASSPVDPTLPSSTLAIARVSVAPAVTSIVNANITTLKGTIAPIRRGGFVTTDTPGLGTGSIKWALSGQYGRLMVHGTTSYSFASTNGQSITVSYGYTFTTLYDLLLTVKSDSNIPLIAYMNGTPGVSSSAVRVETPGGGSTTQSGLVHWLAIGI